MDVERREAMPFLAVVDGMPVQVNSASQRKRTSSWEEVVVLAPSAVQRDSVLESDQQLQAFLPWFLRHLRQDQLRAELSGSHLCQPWSFRRRWYPLVELRMRSATPSPTAPVAQVGLRPGRDSSHFPAV